MSFTSERVVAGFPHRTWQPHFLHQSIDCLMVDCKSFTPHLVRNPSIPVKSFMRIEYLPYDFLFLIVRIFLPEPAAMIVEHGWSHLQAFQQDACAVFTPQFFDGQRPLFLSRRSLSSTKACTFFNSATSARRRSFSACSTSSSVCGCFFLGLPIGLTFLVQDAGCGISLPDRYCSLQRRRVFTSMS